MKRFLGLFWALLLVVSVMGESRTKEFKKSFPGAGLKELVVWNRYGNIEIRQEGDVFEIEAMILVDARKLEKVEELLNYIHVTAEEREGVLNVKTIFEKDMAARQLLSGISVGVDYRIKVPAGKSVRVVSQDGNVMTGNFTGNLSVEVIAGNFRANRISGENFSVKLSKGEFEVEEVDVLDGEFKSAQVKIGEGETVTLDCTSSGVQLMEADELNLKSSGGSTYLGEIENLTLTSFYTKHDIQDLGGTLRVDARWGEVNVRNIHFSFSLVDMKTSSTKVGLTFMDGSGYNLELTRGKGMKVTLPESVVLTTKPTSARNVILQTGFIGDKKYSGKVMLNMSGGNLFIQ